MSYAPRTHHAHEGPPKDESTGAILSDSLAAESINEGGSFADGHAVASKQPSKGTNTNNTDTSAARTLDAAPDAEARMATEEWEEDAALKGARGLSRDNSAGESGYDGSESKRSGNGGYESTGSNERAGFGGEDFREAAQKPNGKNLEEGGFDDNAPNASFNQDIGGKNDPGRLAEEKFAKANARDARTAGFEGGRETGPSGTSEGQYDTLGEEQA